MYKTLGFRWLFEVFCPASAFATADRDETRNPQRFIHVSVSNNNKKNTLNNEKIKTTFYLFSNLSLDLIARIQCTGVL
jgi:hypothetical protein